MIILLLLFCVDERRFFADKWGYHSRKRNQTKKFFWQTDNKIFDSQLPLHYQAFISHQKCSLIATIS
jgi:hypothetical protein